MKKFWLCVAGIVVLACLAGCEDDTKEKAKRLSFENQSRRTVRVYPLTREWQAFPLAPGEKRMLHDIRNPDFRYEPKDLVQEGRNSKPRYVLFVDAPPKK